VLPRRQRLLDPLALCPKPLWYLITAFVLGLSQTLVLVGRESYVMSFHSLLGNDRLYHA